MPREIKRDDEAADQRDRAERPGRRQLRQEDVEQRDPDREVEKAPEHIDDGRGFADAGRRGERRLKAVTRRALHDMRKRVRQERASKEPADIDIPDHGQPFRSYPKRSRERSLAFSASTSRSRAGACVCNECNSRWAAAETSSTARLKAASLPCDGLLKPESLRTNCSAEA